MKSPTGGAVRRLLRRTTHSAIAAVLLVAVSAVPAFAFWVAGGAGSGTATTTTVNKANTPTVAVSGARVALSWNSSTLANGVSVSAYDVLRHDGASTVTVCSATTATSCYDDSPSVTTVRYGVVARMGSSWTGPESDLSAPFTFDSAAPTTAINRSPVEPASTWHTTDVQITLTATDGTGSGVKEIRYTLNNGPEQVSTANPTVFTVTREDANALAFWAVDNAGNIETPHKTAAVKVDKTAPVTASSLSGTLGSNGWYTSDVTVSLAPTDTSPNVGASSSGVSKTEYQLNSTSGSWAAGTSVPVTTAGTTTVNFKSTDLAGNVEATKSVTVNLDKVAPTINTPVLTPAPNGAGWNMADTTVTLSATDATSTVDRLEYQLNATSPGGWQAYPSGGVVISAAGVTTVNYRAFDKAGNVAAGSKVVQLDKVAPSLINVYPSTGTYSKNVAWPAAANGSCAAGQVCVDASDAGSTIASVTYVYTGGDGTTKTMTLTSGTAASGTWKGASGAETMPNGTGKKATLTITVTDVAGNVTTSTQTLTSS